MTRQGTLAPPYSGLPDPRRAGPMWPAARQAQKTKAPAEAEAFVETGYKLSAWRTAERGGRPSDRTAFVLTSANRWYYWVCGILGSRLTHLLTHYYVISVRGILRASFARKTRK